MPYEFFAHAAFLYSFFGSIAAVSCSSHWSETSVRLPWAARLTPVERLANVHSHPLCPYVHLPYGRTFTPPMLARSYGCKCTFFA